VHALRGAGVKVVLKSPLMSLNAPEYAEYVELVAGLGADYSLDPKLNPRENGDMGPTVLGVSKREYLAVRADPRFTPRRSTRERPLDTPPCGACTGNVHIEPNGELRPCTQWSIPTGNATTTSLREAWYENPAARHIRSLAWNDLPGCRECDLRPHCQRCFAEAEHHTGDPLAPYARACRSARWKYEAEVGVEPEIDSASGLCAALPLGPFRQLGEHRFGAAEPAEPAPGATLEATAAATAKATAEPGATRAALHSARAGALVPLRRRAGGPTLTGGDGSPSERVGRVSGQR
jgi:radical SAM protein with 4Fe4S-binding SPASM domain